MRRASTEKLGRGIRLAAFIVIPALLLASGAYGHSGSGTQQVPCTVNYLRLRITTGGDDLRGWDGMSTSKDNLDVTVYFGEQGSQLAADVNKDQRWQNNSMHLVEIKLNQAVPLEQIKGLKLEHTGSSGASFDAATGSTPLGPAAGIQSPDTWDMQSLEVTAVGGGVGATILRHGPKVFTNGDRTLSTRVQIPANSCEVGERFGRLNPGSRTMQNLSGGGSKYGKEQLAPSTIQPAPKVGAQQLHNNRLIQQALAHTVQVGPRASVPGGMADGSTRAIIAILHRQSAAARGLLLPPVRPSGPNTTMNGGSSGASQGGTLLNRGANAALSPQPLPPKGSVQAGAGQTRTLLNPGTASSLSPQPLPPKGTPQVGAGQTMSAPGNSSGTSAATSAASSSAAGGLNPALAQQSNGLTPTNGPSAHRPPAGRQPQSQVTGARPPMATGICKTGIATVDGAANGVWFSPVAGQDGEFVIQGCGFGSMPGQVYLSGVQYDATHSNMAVQPIGISSCAGCVYFTIPPNQWKNSQQFTTSWSDGQIVAQIDPNASGFYDTNNVTLNVKTASGQVYQAVGMNFLAARADQLLKWIVPAQTGYNGFGSQSALVSSPTAVIHLQPVTDSTGNQMIASIASPSAMTVWTYETLDTVRAKLGESTPSRVTFPGGTDTYQLSLAPGFQLDPQIGVRMRHTQIDVDQCRRDFNGSYGANGLWAISYTSATSFQISWQEQECWPKPRTQGLSPLDYGSVSAYALQITVLGPRGASPWASGNVNGLAIKQLQPVQMLKKP